MEYPHQCLKCGTQYTDNDPDPYYCEVCIAERKVLAAEIDAKVRSRGVSRPTVSSYQEYEAAEKVRGFMPVKL